MAKVNDVTVSVGRRMTLAGALVMLEHFQEPPPDLFALKVALEQLVDIGLSNGINVTECELLPNVQRSIESWAEHDLLVRPRES